MRATISVGKRILFSRLPPHASAAGIGAQYRKLVDQVAFRSHDLDAVIAALGRELGAANEVVDSGLHLAGGERTRDQPIDRRLDLGGADQALVPCAAAGMQDLQQHLGAVIVHRAGDRTMNSQFLARIENGRAGFHEAGLVGRVAAADDHGHATFGARGIKGDLAGERIAGLLHAGVHGAHDDPVLENMGAGADGRKQRRIGRNVGNGGFGHEITPCESSGPRTGGCRLAGPSF